MSRAVLRLRILHCCCCCLRRLAASPRPPRHIAVRSRVTRPHPLLLIVLVHIFSQADPVRANLRVEGLHVLRQLEIINYVVYFKQIPVHLLAPLVSRSPIQAITKHSHAIVADELPVVFASLSARNFEPKTFVGQGVVG